MLHSIDICPFVSMCNGLEHCKHLYLLLFRNNYTITYSVYHFLRVHSSCDNLTWRPVRRVQHPFFPFHFLANANHINHRGESGWFLPSTKDTVYHTEQNITNWLHENLACSSRSCACVTVVWRATPQLTTTVILILLLHTIYPCIRPRIYHARRR